MIDFYMVRELKVCFSQQILSVLRILKGGLIAKDVAEMSGFMSTSVCQQFFKDFTRLFVRHFEAEFLKILEGDELRGSMQIYSMLGLPGCFGSIDAKFIPCEGTMMNLKNLMSGDKGSGLLFNVIVDHSIRVLFVQDPVYATVNDKISVKYNDIVNMLIEKSLLPNITFQIMTGDGENDFIFLSSCYLIADGGYLNIAQLISAFDGCQSDRVKYKFSDWIARVCKDIECFFGILKKRFRWFKVPSLLREIDDIKDVFKTACIIHNMILSYDGLDRLWENDAH